MKTELILVGKTTNKHIVACINDYVERISHYMPFALTVIPELRQTKSLTAEQQKEREGALILQKLQPTDVVVLLYEASSLPNGCNANNRWHEGWYSSWVVPTVSHPPSTHVPTSSYHSPA